MTEQDDSEEVSAMMAIYSTTRGGQKLPTGLVRIISEYQVSLTLEPEDVKVEDVLDDAAAAWEAEKNDALPKRLAQRIKDWLASKPASAPSAPHVTFAGGNVQDEMDAKNDEEDDLFGDAGHSTREALQLAEDKAKQKLTGAQIVVLSSALYIGRVPVASEVVGVVRYGSDHRVSDLIKQQRKAGIATMMSILDGSNVRSELSRHFTRLIAEYAERGRVTEASLITMWWSETQAICPTEAVLVAYVKEYFRKYPGRGLPTQVDVLVATHCTVSSQGDSAINSKVSEAKEAVKAAQRETKELKSEMNTLKQTVKELKAEMGRLKGKSPPKESGGEADEPQPWHKKMTCNKCGKKGHIAKFCTEEDGEDGEDK